MPYYSGAKKRTSYGGGYNNRRTNNSKPRTNRGRGQYIDPAKFVQAAKQQDVEQYSAKHVFADFAINELIKDNLKVKGYVTPSPIQDQAIPAILEGKDIIGIANTGTGKTAAFAVPIINDLMANRNDKALIIAPTRELAQQIQVEFNEIAKGAKIYSALLIGGSSYGLQLRDLRGRPQLVIGTPGRIKDHIERRTLRLDGFNKIVLDEVDRMLDMGFVNDVRHILSSTAQTRQSMFFSATLDAKVKDLIQTFSHEPVHISVKTGATSDNVHQDVIKYKNPGDKIDHLHDALLKEEVKKVIVFDETQRSVEKLSQELISRGFATDAIHGGKNQGQRQRALRRFKDNDVDILVATDVAARGIDVADVTHVINYSIPQTYDDYTHRVGRAGRAGKTGHALTFVQEQHRY